MKEIIATFMFALISWNNLADAQTPDWLWAKAVGGIYADNAMSVSTDASGNVYMCGSFGSPTISFGTTTLSNAGYEDIFIVKYDPSGNVLWANRAGGIDPDRANCVLADANGNVFMAGLFFSSTITFGTITLTNAGYIDMFIVKYDASGNVLWAKSEGGANEERINSLSTDAIGNVYATGTFDSNSLTIGTTTLYSFNTQNTFITKYDLAGNVIWAKSSVCQSSAFATSVTTDGSGNEIICGIFDGFSGPNITFGTTTLTNVGSYDIFIVKYDSSGNVLWAKLQGGIGDDRGLSISSDSNGNIVMTGLFSSPSITFGTTTLTNSGNSDIFIVKYDSSGNVLWAKKTGSTQEDIGYSISTNSSGNIYLAGTFKSPIITFGASILTNAGNKDIFIAEYDSNGSVLWADGIGSSNEDLCQNVCTDGIGNVYMVGKFSSPTIFFSPIALTNLGSEDIFIAKFDATTLGIKAISEYSTISLAPNPFSSELIITFNKEQKNTSIEIRNILGKTMKSITFSGNQYVLEKGDLKAGIYYLQTIDEKKNTDNRIIAIQ